MGIKKRVGKWLLFRGSSGDSDFTACSVYQRWSRSFTLLKMKRMRLVKKGWSLDQGVGRSLHERPQNRHIDLSRTRFTPWPTASQQNNVAQFRLLCGSCLKAWPCSQLQNTPQTPVCRESHADLRYLYLDQWFPLLLKDLRHYLMHKYATVLI